MRIPEPLRNNPFRFRRRRSLHDMLYGKRGSDYGRPLGDTSSQKSLPTSASSTPEIYMSDSPEEYAPHPGFMQMPQPDYQPYDNHIMRNVPQLDRQRIADETRFAAMEQAGIQPAERQVKYEDSLMDEDFFEQQMNLLNAQFEKAITASFDTDAQEIFDAQETLFDMPEPEVMSLEQSVEAIEPSADLMPESLEQSIMAEDTQDEGAIPNDMTEMPDYDSALMAQEPFGDQMDEVMEEHMPQEAEPDPLQQHDGMIQQEMYDEQMPDEMMDPFMMPGMMDPYMMPGPFGPMPFGPRPGPSGGP